MAGSSLPELSFRQASHTVGDSNGFCALSNSLYARPVDSAYFSWQFFETPFPSLTTVAVTADGELCGSYTLHIQSAFPDDAYVAWVVDIMVSPKYQRQGVLRLLTEYALEQARPFDPVALCVMANEKAYRACVEGLGWQRVNTFSTWLMDTSASIEANPRLSYHPIDNFESCEVLLEGGANSPFLGMFANRRSASYLNWRFVQNPRYAYSRFLVEGKSGIFGYLVLKLFGDPITHTVYGDIVDIYWIDDDTESIRDMLQFAQTWFKQAGASTAAIWLQTNTRLDQVGIELGFKSQPLSRYFCCRTLSSPYDWLNEPSRWFITMADSEIY